MMCAEGAPSAVSHREASLARLRCCQPCMQMHVHAVASGDLGTCMHLAQASIWHAGATCCGVFVRAHDEGSEHLPRLLCTDNWQAHARGFAASWMHHEVSTAVRSPQPRKIVVLTKQALSSAVVPHAPTCVMPCRDMEQMHHINHGATQPPTLFFT